jgi:hypothetical protein
LDLEMQKRRERIEKWRLERKMQEIAQVKSDLGNNLEITFKKTDCLIYFIILPSF